MEAQLSNRNRRSSLEGNEVSSGGLNKHRLTNQMKGVIALAWYSLMRT